MKNKRISILGCGWLGFALAKRLAGCGWEVKGSVTQDEKIALLDENGIAPVLLEFQPQCTNYPQEQVKFFFDADVLFVNIPFRRNLPDPEIYFRQNKIVKEFAEQSKIKRVVFASSTSVYPANSGLVTEQAEFTPDTPRAEALRRTEQLFLKSCQFDAVVLRFGGLYGPGRQIGKFLSGQTKLSGAKDPVNLVHQEDCVGIVSKIVECGVEPGIYNVCSDAHPTREELYTAAAKKANLPQPEFSEPPNATGGFGGSAHPGKVVSNAKIKAALNYVFVHPDPLDGI